MLHEGTGCEPFDDSICEIPIYAKDGSLRAVTRVDPDDWFRFARYPWHLMNNGYVMGRMTTRSYRREKQRGQRVGGPAKPMLMHRLVMGMDPDDRRKVDHTSIVTGWTTGERTCGSSRIPSTRRTRRRSAGARRSTAA